MKRVRSIIAAAFVILIFAAGYFLISSLRSQAASPDMQPDSKDFVVEGVLDTDEVDVASKLPGRLAEVLVDEGDFVKAGQVVAILEAEEIDAKRDQAQAGVYASEAQAAQAGIAAGLEAKKAEDQVGQAKAGVRASEAALGMARQKLAALEKGARPQEIAQVEQAVAAAKAQFETASKTYKRISSLAGEGVIAQQKADEVEMTYLSAEAQYTAAKAKLDLVKEGARIEEIEAARHQVQQALAGVEASKQQLQLAIDAKEMVSIRKMDIQAANQKVAASEGMLREVSAYKKQTKIVAPIDGMVSQRISRAGEIIAPGYAILSIARTDKYWVDVFIDETKFAGRHVGDSIEISIPALGKTIPGKISRLLPAADFATKRSTNERASFDQRAVQLRIILSDHTKDLATGLTARVRFPKTGGK